MSKLVYLSTRYSSEWRSYTRHLCNADDLPLCGVKSSFSYSYEDGECDCRRCLKAIAKIRQQIALNLIHNQMYQYRLPSGQRYLIARQTRWYEVLPEYVIRNVIQLQLPSGDREDFESCYAVIQRMDEIAPLSHWTLEPEGAPLINDEMEGWINREE